MFDAGAIEARLTIDRSQFNRELAGAEADVKKFESGRHEVKISAVFDNASVSKARQAFASLDQAISKDAMSRLRSSPQGSVLGSLNALFSPHPVTGAPSPQQAAQSGLLGKMISAPGGGGPATIAGSNRSSLRTSNSTVATVLGVNDTQLKADAAKAGRDAADSANQAAASEARKKGSGWLGGLLGGAAGFLTGAIGGGTTSGGGGRSNSSSGSFLGNLAGGIGPGILGLGLKSTGAIGLGGALLGALPALGAVGAGVGVLGGGAAALIGTNKQLQSQAKTMLSSLTATIASAAQPLVAPLVAAFSQIPQFLKSIEPELKSLFSAAAPLMAPLLSGLESLVKNLLPGLTTILKAAQPAFQAFSGVLGTLGKDLGQVFADFAPAIKASVPLFTALFDLLGSLLPVIAQLASIFAKALGPVFVQFAGVIKALEPAITIIGKILASLAKAVLGDLVAAFSAAATVLKIISPALDTLAGVLGQVFTTLENSGVFAVLGDAIEGLAKPLGNLIVAFINGLVPVLPQVVKLVGQLAGLFTASLVGAISNLLPPLTKLATAVLGAIAQSLPSVVNAFIGLAKAILSPGLISAITNLVGQLVILVANATPSVISAIAGALTAIAKAVTQPGVISAVSGVVNFLTDLVKKVPPAVLSGIALGVVAIVGALKLWAIAQTIIDGLLSANPIGLIILAIGLLVIAITELVKHWSTVWNAIKDAAVTVWHAIYNTVLSPLIDWFTVSLPHAFDTALTHVTGWWTDVKNLFVTGWHAVYNDVLNPIGTFFTVTLPGWFDKAISFLQTKFVTPFQNGLKGAYNWVVTNVFDPLATFLTKTIPDWFSTAVADIGKFWTGVEAKVLAPVKYVVNNILNPIGQTFDTITNALGLGKPIPALHLARGGKLGGFGGGDSVPAMLEPGETVIDKDKSRAYAWLFKLMGVPGFAAGGTVPPVSPGAGSRFGPIAGVGGVTASIGNAIGKAVDVAKITAAIATGNSTALTNALQGLVGNSFGGAAGEMLKIVTAIPADAIKDLVSWVTGRVSTSPGGGASLGPGSGNYAADITAVLKSMGLPLTLVANWLRQIATESGGDLQAVNMSDSNFIAGHPSVGLLQIIPSTFAAYAGPYRNTPPLVNKGGGTVSENAMAQIYAAIHYAAAAYGGAAMANVIGQGHGYSSGGWITEPVVGYGLSSGDMYTLGERGSEYVTPAGGMAGGGVEARLASIENRLVSLIGVTSAVPAGVGRHVGGAINGSAQNASFRSRYPHGGA